MNQALQDVIEHRRTTNVFEPNHTISDEQIEHLVHLATRAPTSFNLQNCDSWQCEHQRGRPSFVNLRTIRRRLPDAVAKGELRPLRNPEDTNS
jgi:Nitroreductase